MMIPIQAKLIAAAGVVIVSFTSGFKTSDHFAKVEAARVKSVADAALLVQKDKALAAEMIARSAENRADSSIANATSTFEKVRENEKAITDRVIADLRGDVTRLRVSTKKPAARPAGVPGAPATTCSSDDQTESTLSGSVAARLAGRYADYNALVGQLELCQATLIIDREMTVPR